MAKKVCVHGKSKSKHPQEGCLAWYKNLNYLGDTKNWKKRKNLKKERYK